MVPAVTVVLSERIYNNKVQVVVEQVDIVVKVVMVVVMVDIVVIAASPVEAVEVLLQQITNQTVLLEAVVVQVLGVKEVMEQVHHNLVLVI